MTPIGDDELREMLEARGDRQRIDLRSMVGAARRDAIASGPRARHAWGFAAVLAGVGSVVALALVLAVAMVVVPLSMRPSTSAGPSALVSPTDRPSATSDAPSPSEEAGPAPVEALTAQNLAAWLRDVGASAKGRVVLLEGELIMDPTVDCIAEEPDCAPTVVRGAPMSIVIEPVGDIGPGPWDGSGPLTGTFALRGTDRTWFGTSPVMEFLGTVRPAASRIAWQVPELEVLAPADGPDWYLVAGWMVRTPAHPCPSPASAYGCPTDDILTPVRVQPTKTDGRSVGPEVAMLLPSGTYDEFAPDPALDGAGVVPRAATFLVQRISVPPCSPDADCYVGPEHRRWIVRARVDQIPAADESTPAPTPPAAGSR